MNSGHEHKLKFFIVEDNNIYNYMLSYSIDQLYPCYIQTYDKVETLLDEAKGMTPDFILLDHFFEGRKGIDSIDQIISKYPTSKIVVISSKATDELITKVHIKSNCFYLSKMEFTAKKLSEIIDKQIHQS